MGRKERISFKKRKIFFPFFESDYKKDIKQRLRSPRRPIDYQERILHEDDEEQFSEREEENWSRKEKH